MSSLTEPAGAASMTGGEGEPLRLVAEGPSGVLHELAGEAVVDGDLLDLLTANGWVLGHYRDRLHPETGCPAFEIHLRRVGHGVEHAIIHLPADALLRRPAEPPS